MFEVVGVLKTWGVDEFIACDWTSFLSMGGLSNEVPCRSKKDKKVSVQALAFTPG